VNRARALCDEDSLQAELMFPRDNLKYNEYNDWKIHRILNHHPQLDQLDKPKSVTFLAFVGTIFNEISRVLA
jgi:hypothetical protein